MSPDVSADAFEAMYRAHSRVILSYLARRVDEPAAAADLLADVFLVAWRRRDDLPCADEQRLWLFGVARNTLLGHHRRRLRDARLGEKLAAALAVVTDPAPRDDDDRVRDALGSLSARDRELLTLTAWEGLDSEQIAAVVGLTPNAVRVALHRARQRFRLALTTSAAVPCPDITR